MEANTEGSRQSSSSAKIKPLSDSTNLLIPTSTIYRKLSSSSLSTEPSYPNRFHKPNAKSKPKSKPYNFPANKPDTNSSKSDTSIGSSSYNVNAPNTCTFPHPHPSTPPRVPLTKHGDGSEDVCEPLVLYSRRQTAEKPKDRGKAVAMPFACPPLQRTKDNAKADTVPFSLSPMQKKKDKGMATAVPLPCSLLGKTRDKEKEVTIPYSFPSQGKKQDGEKAVSLPPSCPSPVKTRIKRKATAMPFSCTPLPRSRKTRNDFSEVGGVGLFKSNTDPHPKQKKRRCCLLPKDDSEHALPQEFIKQQRAYFKEVDEFELPEEEISEIEFIKEEKDHCDQDSQQEHPR